MITTIAIIIIAICEVIRAIQNAIQLKAISSDDGMRKRAYEEFIESLNRTDKEFIKKMLKDLERGAK